MWCQEDYTGLTMSIEEIVERKKALHLLFVMRLHSELLTSQAVAAAVTANKRLTREHRTYNDSSSIIRSSVLVLISQHYSPLLFSAKRQRQEAKWFSIQSPFLWLHFQFYFPLIIITLTSILSSRPEKKNNWFLYWPGLVYAALIYNFFIHY